MIKLRLKITVAIWEIWGGDLLHGSDNASVIGPQLSCTSQTRVLVWTPRSNHNMIDVGAWFHAEECNPNRKSSGFQPCHPWKRAANGYAIYVRWCWANQSTIEGTRQLWRASPRTTVEFLRRFLAQVIRGTVPHMARVNYLSVACLNCSAEGGYDRRKTSVVEWKTYKTGTNWQPTSNHSSHRFYIFQLSFHFPPALKVDFLFISSLSAQVCGEAKTS